ncbi:arginine/serine-rich coiled-coil protein 2 [Anoplophora glabripennis]|uniref:arginine/serine-rich coiled-coil protein 2 n=1 Tax=Anoplophora glabripennis TaxID=217634 RepID=UPI0008748CC8|nr:arginine/serine-rich coiled-coil protein 2 [Anoplophora glabripennis]
MNPSASRIWDNPPPPGTEEELSNTSSKVEGSTTSGSRTIDRIDPYLKSPEYIDFEKKHQETSKYRSRSKSREKHHRRRHSRSRSRDRRHRRSRSRSHRRHKRKRSSSRSRSRSPGFRHGRRRHGRYRRSASRYSRSRSRSTSRSRPHRSHRSKSDRDKKSETPRKSPDDKPLLDADINEVDMKIEEEEEEEEEEDQVKCVFKNDGSFLEMFKKMQEQQKAQESVASAEEKKPAIPAFGKRRGGKVLKTGLVQKVRLTTEEETNAQDAWSVYMKEVRRYKEACCDDDSKTRPLVK